MKKLIALSLALGLTGFLGACTKKPDTGTPPEGGAPPAGEPTAPQQQPGQ